jgi:hypothetical protein
MKSSCSISFTCVSILFTYAVKRILKWLGIKPLIKPSISPMPLIFPLRSLTDFHVYLHQASAFNITNPLDRDHTSYVLFSVPYYPLSMLLACLSQPLSSTTPPSTKTLPEHIHGPSVSPSPWPSYPSRRPRITNLHGSGLHICSHTRPLRGQQRIAAPNQPTARQPESGVVRWRVC